MRTDLLSDAVRRLRRRGGTSSAITDRDLLAAVAEGNGAAAFRQLVDRHGPMVYGVCRRVLGNPADVDDAFQATFLVLAKKSASSGWHDSIANWLHGVAFRIALRARGRAARRKHHESRTPAREIAESPDVLEMDELRGIVDEEIARLPEKLRLPVLLCCLHDRTVDEAAATLGLSPTTVKGRLQTGRDRLRERLAGRRIGIGAGVQAALVPGGTAVAVPPHLAEAAAIPLASAVSDSISTLASSEISAMFWTQLRTSAVVAGALAASVLGLAVLNTSAAPIRPDPPPRYANAPSEPARVGDLQVVVRPATATVVAGDNLRFEFAYTNRGEKPLALYDVGHEVVSVRITRDGNANDYWEFTPQADPARKRLDPRTIELPSDPAGNGGRTVEHIYAWDNARGERVKPAFLAPMPIMEPGRYRAVATIRFAAPADVKGERKVPYWTGEIATEHVTFFVSDKPGFPPASPLAKKDGLAVSLRPTKFAFAHGETPTFDVQFLNVGKERLAISGTRHAVRGWTVQLIGGTGEWVAKAPPLAAAPKPTTYLLASASLGTQVECIERCELGGPFGWNGPQDKPIRPIDRLPVGRYAMRARIVLEAPQGGGWGGEIETEPVDFAVAERAIDGPSIVEIGPKDDKQTVAVKVGQVIRIDLPNDKDKAGWEGGQLQIRSGPTSTTVVANDGVLRETVDPRREMLPGPNATDPAIGVYRREFLAVAAGNRTIELTHVYPSGPETGARTATKFLGKFTVSIVVQK